MGDGTAKSQFETIVERLTSAGVEFLVIGGRAEGLMGSPRVTYDTDLCYRRTHENIERLANALKPLQPTLRGAPPGLPFRPDAQTLEMGTNFTFETIAGDLDLLGHVEPIGGYEELAKHAETMDVGGVLLKVASLNDLIRIKRHVNRPKDREALLHLLAIQRVREDNRQL